MKDYRCIPSKEDADFVACMEDILDVYELPYSPMYPVVCMDEKPYQLLDNIREPLPARPGNTQKVDSEYKRNGTCSIFILIHYTVHQICLSAMFRPTPNTKPISFLPPDEPPHDYPSDLKQIHTTKTYGYKKVV